MGFQRRTAIAAGITLGLIGIAAPAGAKGGEVDGYGDRYFLTNGWDGTSDEHFIYGRTVDRVYVGDWNNGGVDTLAVRRGATYHFKYSLTGGDADHVTTYGRDGDIVLMGDWDGDGIDTPAVRRGATYHFKNSLTGGDADQVITYGKSDDVVFVGDWDGDGKDTLGVRRGHTYHLKNDISGGDADEVVTYGRRDDEVLVGDWDGRGGDTLAVRRGNEFHAKNSISGGDADLFMRYGRTTDGVLVGDWDGDGTDTIGLRRFGSAGLPPVRNRDEYDARMIDLINAERAAAGVPPVSARPQLRSAAIAHSRWMAEEGKIQHAESAEIRADARAAGCTAGGEHIVRTYQRGTPPDPQDAMDWYMNSSVHRAGILNPNNTHVAVGTVQAGDFIYNTQRFVRNCS